MIFIVCTTCSNALRVTGDPSEVDYLVGPGCDEWPDGFTCPTCGSKATGLLDAEIAEAARGALKIRDLTPAETFAALNGLGLPDEQLCGKVVLQELLREKPIRNVAGKDLAGTTRFQIDHLELWDGTKVYFGSSRDGAVVYRIARPHSYAEKVHG